MKTSNIEHRTSNIEVKKEAPTKELTFDRQEYRREVKQRREQRGVKVSKSVLP